MCEITYRVVCLSPPFGRDRHMGWSLRQLPCSSAYFCNIMEDILSMYTLPLACIGWSGAIPDGYAACGVQGAGTIGAWDT